MDLNCMKHLRKYHRVERITMLNSKESISMKYVFLYYNTSDHPFPFVILQLSCSP